MIPQIAYLYIAANGRAWAPSQPFEEVRGLCVKSFIARIGCHAAISQKEQLVGCGSWEVEEMSAGSSNGGGSLVWEMFRACAGNAGVSNAILNTSNTEEI